MQNRKTDTAADVFDRARALEAVGGDDALLAQRARVLLLEAGTLRDDLRDAIASGDVARATRAAHALAGAAGALCADEVAGLARTLEALGHAGRLEGVEARCEDLEAAVERLAHELEAAAPERT